MHEDNSRRHTHTSILVSLGSTPFLLVLIKFEQQERIALKWDVHSETTATSRRRGSRFLKDGLFLVKKNKARERHLKRRVCGSNKTQRKTTTERAKLLDTRNFRLLTNSNKRKELHLKEMCVLVFFTRHIHRSLKNKGREHHPKGRCALPLVGNLLIVHRLPWFQKKEHRKKEARG